MIISKNCKLEKLKQRQYEHTNIGKAYRFLFSIANIIESMPYRCPQVLEFGVADGISTSVFADVLEKKNGKLISVDPVNCSDVISGEFTKRSWKFLRTYDYDTKTIFNSVERKSFDLIYVDSFSDYKTSYNHMTNVFVTWMPYLVRNGFMVIHGVDSHPYLSGGRKEDKKKEMMYDNVRRAIFDFYYKNENIYDLEMCLGSVGMAFLRKL